MKDLSGWLREDLPQAQACARDFKAMNAASGSHFLRKTLSLGFDLVPHARRGAVADHFAYLEEARLLIVAAAGARALDPAAELVLRRARKRFLELTEQLNTTLAESVRDAA